MATRLSEPVLIEILGKHRTQLNNLFAFTLRGRQGLEAGVFTAALVSLLEPLVCRLRDREPALLETLVLEVSEKLLELTARGLLGKRGKYPWFEACLGKLLLCFADTLLTAPGVLLASFINALINITAGLGERVTLWTEKLLQLPAVPPDAAVLKKCGFVAAWSCGMAHYREQALGYCAELAAPLAGALLGVEPRDLAGGRQAQLLAQLRQNPWATPAALVGGKLPEDPCLVVLGGFSGFGGTFTRPPEVLQAAGCLVACDASRYYRIYADCFGSCLQPVDGEWVISHAAEGESGFSVTGCGEILYAGKKYPLPKPLPLPPAASAATGHTLCFTSPLSHKVFVVGMGC